MKAFTEVPWRVKDALAVFILSWVGLPVLIILVLRGLAPVNSFSAGLLHSLASGSITANFVLVLLDAILGLLLVGLYLRRYNLGWSAVGWRSFNVGQALFYLLMAILIFFIAVAALYALVSFIFPHFNANQAQVNDFTKATSPGSKRLSFLALVVIPPFIEETVFRGFIFPAFAKRFGLVIGMIATSLLFGLAHLQLNVSLYTLILSLLLCMMYYKLGSIWPGIILHMVNNYLAYMAILQK